MFWLCRGVSPLGGIEGKLEDRESYHIFTNSKADWYEIIDDLEQYDELPSKTGKVRKINQER